MTCFSLVVSIIGSFMATLLAFVLPPLMHLELVVRGRGAAEAEPGDEEPGLAAARDVVRGRRPPRALDVAQDIACAALERRGRLPHRDRADGPKRDTEPVVLERRPCDVTHNRTCYSAHLDLVCS